MYLITKPAATSAASRATISSVSGKGIKFCHVSVMKRVAMRTLSAIGSRKEPILDAWPSQFLAIQPSSCNYFFIFL